jgi:hypothetical protein
MSSFDIPSLHDGRNEGILLPSDEVISVTDEKDGHSVSLLFLSFNQERFDCRFAREFFLSIPETRHDLLHHTCSTFLNPLSIPSHRPKPMVPLLFLIRIILSIISILV